MTDLYGTFLEATRNVLKLMLELNDVSDHPADAFACEEELDVSIGFIGDLKGEVIYRLPHETSLGIVTIMSGMEFDAVDEFVTSAVSEVANIISGNVLTMLAGEDLTCDILPPVLRKPAERGEYTFQTACCVNTSIGDVCLDIRLNQAE
ncbi:chemotaxis protein CheX [Lacrimispora sp.]|uniref:chemotaxis protein CheX n=1 Tax=Lacrimispora sp. TaxID=2719234 RepID=UPI0028AF784C|nr:chemotaxis protein CheX [Lacrimispora sp.]